MDIRERPMRVLVVDDERNIRHTLRVCLEGFGCEVREAATPDAALAYGWPGNVRELRNAMERALIVWPAAALEPQAFPDRSGGGGRPGDGAGWAALLGGHRARARAARHGLGPYLG